MRPVRNAHRTRRVCRRHGFGFDRQDSRARARLVGSARRHASVYSSAATPRACQGSKEAPARYRGRQDRDRRDRRGAAGRYRVAAPAPSWPDCDMAAVGRAGGDSHWPSPPGSRYARSRGTRSPTRGSRASRIGKVRKSAPKSRPTGGSWPSSPTRPDSSTCG